MKKIFLLAKGIEGAWLCFDSTLSSLKWLNPSTDHLFSSSLSHSSNHLWRITKNANATFTMLWGMSHVEQFRDWTPKYIFISYIGISLAVLNYWSNLEGGVNQKLKILKPPNINMTSDLNLWSIFLPTLT